MGSSGTRDFRCPHCGAFITATHNGAVKDVKANVPVPRTVSGRFLDPKADPLELVRSLCNQVRDGDELETQGEFETFADWRARRESEVAAKIGGAA